jgi:hypothetical protein
MPKLGSLEYLLGPHRGRALRADYLPAFLIASSLGSASGPLASSHCGRQPKPYRSGLNRRALIRAKVCRYIFFCFFVLAVFVLVIGFVAPPAIGAVASEPDFAAAPPLVPLAPPV